MRLGRFEIIKGESPRFLTRVIRSSIRAVMAYTAASFAMVWVTGNAPPDALTVAFFAYWSFENGAAALIRIRDEHKQKEETDELE